MNGKSPCYFMYVLEHFFHTHSVFLTTSGRMHTCDIVRFTLFNKINVHTLTVADPGFLEGGFCYTFTRVACAKF